MLFAELAAASGAVAATSGRRAKVQLLAEALRRVSGERSPVEIAAATAYLSGDLRQRHIGVGWAGLRDLPPPALTARLSVSEVDSRLGEVEAQSGSGSQTRRKDLVRALFGAATAEEQAFLRGIIAGELRQGAQVGLVIDAVAVASTVPVATVRRALLLSGDLKTVAAVALTGGESALLEFRLTVGRPLAPMLAASAASPGEALIATGMPAVADAKLDGVRIQVHRDKDDVAIFSRSLDDLTSRLPEIVERIRRLPISQLVIDGEVLAVDEAGRARPFQETSSRAAKAVPGALTPFFFDALHIDGSDLVDEGMTIRWTALRDAVPAELLVARTIVETAQHADEAMRQAIDAGHEGIVVKAADSHYDVGRRGSAWVKVKPRHTLDLVVIGAEWGHGRRHGWLSNLHLAARDPAGGYVMLGKTFKGLTDRMLEWQTARLIELATERDSWTVIVRPELVAEIAFDGVQTSSRYPGGVTLRFARVVRYRDDKTADHADTIETVRKLANPHGTG